MGRLVTDGFYGGFLSFAFSWIMLGFRGILRFLFLADFPGLEIFYNFKLF
jgi:hypothetical protein